MAVVHKFRRNVTDLNLNAGAGAGWRTVAWNPKVATPAYGEVPEPVEETLTLLADCSSQDDLATKLQALDAMRRYADEYVHDRVQEHPVWWHAKMYSETGERRALVRKIETEINCPLVTRADWVENNRAVVRARVTREGLWERTAATTEVTGSGISVLGGVFDYTASDVVGDVPARIYQLNLTTSVTSLRLDHVWIGFRSANKRGTLTNFEPLWELEDGGAVTDTALAADETASPGGEGNTKMVTSFTTDSGWRERVTIETGDVTSHHDDNRGMFLVLLRAKVDSGTTAEVQLRVGYSAMDDDDYVEKAKVEISATSWTEYEMAVLTIPLRDIRATRVLDSEYDNKVDIQIWARRTAGSDSLHLDCLNLIPVDEYYIFASATKLIYEPGDATYFYFGVAADGRSYGVSKSGRDIVALAQIETGGAGVPVGDGRLYVVAARENKVNDISDTYDVGIQFYPRWLTLRGAE